MASREFPTTTDPRYPQTMRVVVKLVNATLGTDNPMVRVTVYNVLGDKIGSVVRGDNTSPETESFREAWRIHALAGAKAICSPNLQLTQRAAFSTDRDEQFVFDAWRSA